MGAVLHERSVELLALENTHSGLALTSVAMWQSDRCRNISPEAMHETRVLRDMFEEQLGMYLFVD